MKPRHRNILAVTLILAALIAIAALLPTLTARYLAAQPQPTLQRPILTTAVFDHQGNQFLVNREHQYILFIQRGFPDQAPQTEIQHTPDHLITLTYNINSETPATRHTLNIQLQPNLLIWAKPDGSTESHQLQPQHLPLLYQAVTQPPIRNYNTKLTDRLQTWLDENLTP